MTVSPIEFKPLTIEDKPIYDVYYNKSGTRISDVHMASRMAWGKGFNYVWTEIRDTLLVLSPKSVFSTIHFSMPLGLTSKEQMEGIVDDLWDEYAPRFAEQTGSEPHLRFLYLEKSDLQYFNFLDKYESEILMKPAFSDYVYAAENLQTLRGKFYNGKRNHVNKFMRAYPFYEFRPLQKEDEEVCLNLVSDWGEEKTENLEDLRKSDYVPTQTLFRYFDELEMSGGTLWVGKDLVAFSMVSPGAKDTCIVHIEKADVSYRGSYAVINKLTAETICEDTLWINREEDMGIEGLHKAKQSYGPSYMVDKYEVRLTKK